MGGLELCWTLMLLSVRARAWVNLGCCFCAACGGFIELSDDDPPGYITSPNYPENYPQNIDCIWVVTVPNGESVRIDFEEDFYIEASSRYSSTLLTLQGNPNPLKG